MKRRAAILTILAILLVLGCFSGCQGVKSIRVSEVIQVEDTPQGPEAAMIFVQENVGVADTPQPAQGIFCPEIIGVTDGARVVPAILIRLSEVVRVADAAAVRPRQVQPTLPAPTSTPKPTPKLTPKLTPTPTLKPTPTPVPLAVKVIYPKEGAIWAVGSLQNITWVTTGDGIAYIGIYYSLDGGKSMYSISPHETNDGAFAWKVPNTPGKSVLVRVLAYNANGVTLALDDSGLFTISGQ